MVALPYYFQIVFKIGNERICDLLKEYVRLRILLKKKILDVVVRGLVPGVSGWRKIYSDARFHHLVVMIESFKQRFPDSCLSLEYLFDLISGNHIIFVDQPCKNLIESQH